MKKISSERIKFALMAFAFAMMFCVALPLTSAKMSGDSKQEPQSAGRVNSSHDPKSHKPNLILFKRGALDTRASAHLDTAAEDLLAPSGQVFAESVGARKQLRIVQFSGPVMREWIEQLKATGSEIIGYIPNNSYIIRGTAAQLAGAAAFDRAAFDGAREADDAQPIQWMGRFQPIQKIAPAFDAELLARGEGISVDVEIELFDSSETAQAIERINSFAFAINHAPRHFSKFVVLSLTLPVEKLIKIAELDEVLFIGPAPSATLHDERAAQIVAANLTASGTEPAGPGYRAWLASKGLNTRPDFVIDFTDSGLDNGSTSEPFIHPDFLDSDGRSRVAYNINYTLDGASDRRGHGSLVASIACGSGVSAQTDEAGYMFGLGVDPAARLGASRIFGQFGRLPFQFSFTNAVATAYQAGARISNNSWGVSLTDYDSRAQEYDALSRDALPGVEGNQEITFVFSAGNNGAGGRISSPGTAKNVITVAASENFRPQGFDSCDLDGGGAIGPDGADNALDILRFSSGGPTFDNRAKPDLAAPGTHIYGSASQAPFYTADGLCPGITIYQPPGQRLYTWSSGTSMAAPHVTGAASLARRFFQLKNLLGDNRAPSPAMLKAYLLNSASYLSGENAGGDLPAARQGWGRVDLGRAFDAANRVFVDQTHLLTESGQTIEIKGSIKDRSKPLRITLAWSDAPGMLAGAALVNDLDLEIDVGGTTIYRGNIFSGSSSIAGGEPDRSNNIEAIFIPAELIPEAHHGNFTIRVRAANIAGDGVPGNGIELDQDFALVVYNIAPSLSEPPPPPPPPGKVPVITSASFVKKRLTISGRDFTAEARVEVNGLVLNRSFAFDAATNSLTIKKKRSKLNLNEGADNRIVIIDNNERSEAFTLRL